MKRLYQQSLIDFIKK